MYSNFYEIYKAKGSKLSRHKLSRYLLKMAGSVIIIMND